MASSFSAQEDFLAMASSPSPLPLLFSLNGSRVLLPSVDPSITLLSYLRLHTRFAGTKLSCGEGGCGACLVLLSTYDPVSKKVEHRTINSCLTLLCSIHGCAVTTIEGLGSTQNGFHAVQERIAGFHGSQCGFCTPGMCMAMYACLRRAHSQEPANEAQDHSLHTIPNLKAEDAQKAIVGNLCRCTGYRPILDACKSFAGDVDVEDLGINTFWASSKEADVTLLPAYSTAKDPVFPQFLIKELHATRDEQGNANGTIAKRAALNFRYVDGGENGEERLWIENGTLRAVFETLKEHQGKSKVKLVVGNTSAGYYKDQKPQVFIDISHVPELLILRETVDWIEVGSAVTLEKLIHALEIKAASSATASDSAYHAIASHLEKVANPHVRNRASVGGNLIMAQQFSFDSDVATVFLALGVTLKIVGADRKPSILSLDEFLEKGSLDPGMILESISIPSRLDQNGDQFPACNGADGISVEVPMDRNHGSCTKRCFKSYRAAPRQLGNSLAFVNAAFLADIAVPTQANGIIENHTIMDARLAFGAFGQGHAIRAQKVENFLIGKTVSPGILLEAIELLKSELATPLKGARKAEYRSSVAVGFMFDFFRQFLPEVPMHSSLNSGVPHCQGKLSNGIEKQSGTTCGVSAAPTDLNKSKTYNGRMYVSGKQTIPPFEENHVVGKPIQKYEGRIQAAGEAVYVDDIPSPDRCLFAAFVLSEKAFAKIKYVDPKLALASPGVVAYISAADIPKGGTNIGAVAFSGSENLFATDVVEFVGHPLGVVVANSPQHAKDAARKVEVGYDLDSLGSPVLSIEDAVDRSSFFPMYPFLTPQPLGDINKGFSEADHMIKDAEVKTGSQYFFYMENQTALAIPDEDDCMLVYSSCQSPDVVQKRISACLGVPSHNIRVITRRVGGGFGGKAFRNITVASACALAAYKLRQPVRMQLDRNTDMIMMGGRHPTRTIYSVGFTCSGKVTGLQAKIFLDAGWSEDLSTMIPWMLIGALKKYDWGSLNVEFKVCKTNLSSKSAMRAPGHLQGSFIADTVLEHVAATLGLDVHTVISKNMHTLDSIEKFYSDHNVSGPAGYTLPSIWNRLLKRVEEREKAVCDFNRNNKWSKRGLSIIPCVYDTEQNAKPARVSIYLDGSVVVEVGGIEIGQGLWTKVRQTAIHGLSQLWPGDSQFAESLKVRVVQADTISLPHGGLTAGSTTSEGSCEAVRQACEILVSRLIPIKVNKEESSKGISWAQLVQAAQYAEVNLSAQIHWFPPKSTKKYLNYGGAASEVEINVLTGETTLIQTDLIYDCGKTVNPAVDIGQIEGSFVQGIGFFVTEEHEVDCNGKVISNGTWTYKPPTLDNIPQHFFVEIINGVDHHNYILSSKACGEPPLLLAGSVHSAIKRAIEASREDYLKCSTGESQGKYLRLDTPATIEKVKNLCGLSSIEQYLKCQTSRN